MKLSPILRCKIGSEQGESDSERASTTKQTSCLKKTSEGEKKFFSNKDEAVQFCAAKLAASKERAQ